jgi:hypothetical protein
LTTHVPLQEPLQLPEQSATGALTDPWQVPVQLPVQPPWSWPEEQVGTVGGVQLPLAVQLASHVAAALTLTWQPPPEMARPQLTLADPPPLMTAVMPAAAALHAAVTWVSSESPLPPAGMAAAVTPAATRSVEMPVQAVRTLCSISVWMVVRDVTAPANAFASTEPLQSELATFEIALAALQPFVRIGSATSVPRTIAAFKAFILVMTRDSLVGRRARTAALDRGTKRNPAMLRKRRP